jgi:CBS domain-containing protein
MQSDVKTIGPRESLARLQDALLKANVGGLPVVESGQIVGIASRSDIVRQLKTERDLAMRNIGLPPEVHLTIEDAIDLGDFVGDRLERIRVEDVMNRQIVTVSPGDCVQAAAKLLTANHIHRLPVVDNGHLVGMIASHDIVRLVADGSFASKAGE